MCIEDETVDFCWKTYASLPLHYVQELTIDRPLCPTSCNTSQLQHAVKQPRDRTRLDRLAFLHRRPDRLPVPPATAIRPPAIAPLPALLCPPVPLGPRPPRLVLAPPRRRRTRPNVLEAREQDGVGSRRHGLVRFRQLALCRTSDHRCVANNSLLFFQRGTDEGNLKQAS